MDYMNEAKKFAKQMRSPYIGTEHVMYAVLDNDKKASKLLGVTAEQFKEELIKVVGVPELNKDGYAKANTPKLNNLLKYFKKKDQEFKVGDFIEIIYDDGEGCAYRILENLGADFEGYLDNMYESIIPDSLLHNDYLVNLNEKVKKQNIHVFGMKDKSDELINNLFRVRKPNIVLVGKAGCGKSALVECLAERINKNDVPEFMKDKIIFEMVVPNAVAGTKYRGEFEERIKNTLKEVQKHPQIILFIDEFHTVMTAGAAEGAVSFANILKPYLARGEISLIGATTTEEYEVIKKDKAMQRRFTVIKMDPPGEEEIMNILKGWKSQLENHYHVSIEDDLLRSIIRQCRKDRLHSSPDKELDALEAWCLEHCNWRAVDWDLVSQ